MLKTNYKKICSRKNFLTHSMQLQQLLSLNSLPKKRLFKKQQIISAYNLYYFNICLKFKEAELNTYCKYNKELNIQIL